MSNKPSKKIGRPRLLNPMTTRVTFRLSDEEYSILQKLSENQNTTITDLFRQYVKSISPK
jgi:hypothetical protein